MKITLLIGSLAGGGAERVTCNLANYLARKGHDVTVLTLSDKKTYHLDSAVRHTVLFGESRTSLPHAVVNVVRMIRMNRYLRKEQMDVYVTFLPKLTKVLLMQKSLVKCPVILTERNDPKTFCEESAKNEKEFDKYYHLADGYVFQTSNAMSYYASRGIDISKGTVISNAINPEFVREPYEGEREKVIIGAGRLTEQKNFPLLLKAFGKIHANHPDYQLVIYGEGRLRDELTALTEKLNISDKVQFPGRTDKLGDKLQCCSLFVLSSDYEGMPNALMEAMALGVPCVSTDCGGGGAKALIENEKNGLLVPAGDENALAEAMDRLLSDSEFAEKLGKGAHGIVDKFSAEKIYAQWEAYLLQFDK